MPRGIPNAAHSSDYVSDGLQGVVDWKQIRSSGGGLNHLEVISKNDREFGDDEVAYAAFMEEPVVIEVHDSADKNAPPAVFVAVNGEGVWLKRRTKIRIPRKFAEVLARSQSMAIKTMQTSDPESVDAMRTMRTTSQDYAFSVLHDPNPRGRAWLERVTREGC